MTCFRAVLFVMALSAMQLSAWSQVEILANSYGFGVDIPECPDASNNIREVLIDELRVDTVDVTTESPAEYRTYQPGSPVIGNLTLTSACTTDSKELLAWYTDVVSGKDIRKNITVTCYKSDKTPGRSYVLLNCLPINWSQRQNDRSRQQEETLLVKPSSIKFIAADAAESTDRQATPSEKFAQVRGFHVELHTKGGKESDPAWESVSGGEVLFQLNNGGRINSPGHKAIDTITLRGPVTSGRQAMCNWLNETLDNPETRSTVSITEIVRDGRRLKDGRQTSYIDCFPVRYKFPRLSVYETNGDAREEIEVCPTRGKGIIKVVTGPSQPRPTLVIEGAPMASESATVAIVDLNALDNNLVPKCGDARDVHFVLKLPGGTGQELKEWYEASARGAADGRKTVMDRDSGRSKGFYVFHNCTAVGYNVITDEKSGAYIEEVRVRAIRVELK